MLRKIQGLCGGIFIITAGNAGAGFYAGAGVGVDTVNFKQVSNVFSTNFDVINKSHLSASGVFGTLFGGYELLCNQFYLAGEINGNLSSTGTTTSNKEFVHGDMTDVILKVNNNFGVSIMPGYQFSPATLFYGRSGMANSKIQQKSSDISLEYFTKRRTGFRYGLGIKQALNERVALRLDYSRVDYHNINTDTADPVGKVSKWTKINPLQQLVELGVVIKFG